MKAIFLYSTIFITALLMGCTPAKKTTSTSTKEDFPKSWEGIWKGNLSIYKGEGKQQEIGMELHILPIDSTNTHTWTIVYVLEDKPSARNYELLTVDAAKGHYQIDEHNGIILDNYLMNNTLYSRFKVSNSILTSSYEKQGDSIIFTIISGNAKPIATTGGTSEDIPPVDSYEIKVMQHAVLTLDK